MIGKLLLSLLIQLFKLLADYIIIISLQLQKKK